MLSETRTRKIAGVAAASNPLYLKTLLDDLRVTGDHEKLDEQIADYLQAADIPALFRKILARYERDYKRDRPGLVCEALSLLWAARRGLTEPELLEVLKPEGQERLPAIFWAPVRCALEDGLVDRDGVLAFAHDHLRVAVEQQYVPYAGAARTLRLRLADAFAARTMDARQSDELPWLLRQAEARDRLRACLLDIDRFLLIRERDQEELLSYWVWLGQERLMGKVYLELFESWSQAAARQEKQTSYAANQLAFFLDHASLYADAESLMRRALAIDKQSYGTNHPKIAIHLNNLAQLLQATNQLSEAELLLRRALSINEESYGPDHHRVAINLNNLGQLLHATNRLTEAEFIYRRVLAIYKESLGPNHPHVAMSLDNLAELLRGTNRFNEAEPIYRRALAIFEESLGPNHPHFATSLNNLVQLLQDTSRLTEAEFIMHRALAIDEKSLGANHPNAASDLNNLAQLLMDTNRLNEAEPLMQRALAIDTGH